MALKKKPKHALPASQLVSQLRKKKLTLATAESITGGGLANAITDVSGSSKVYLGSIIAYSDESKKKFLHIVPSVLKKESAVSEAVAISMAENVRKEFSSTLGISTTGVAGPGSAYGKKAGTVWIGISYKKESFAIELALTGDRESIRREAIACAIAALERILTP